MNILPFALVCALASAAVAAPTLEPFDAGPFTVSVPKGWKVEHDAGTALVIAKLDPARKDSPAILFAMQPAQGADQDHLVTLVNQLATKVKVSRREAISTGQVLVADGVIDGVQVRIGALGTTVNGVAITSMVISRVSDYDGLGGIELSAGMLASVRLAGAGSAAPPAPPAPPASGDKLTVPPLTRVMTLADFAGEWKHDDGVISRYVSTTTGEYTGYSAISVKETWTITSKGEITADVWATTARASGARQVHEHEKGTISIGADGVVAVTLANRPSKRFLLRGWSVGPQLIVMKMNGPYGETVPADVRNDPHMGYNLDQFWVRAAPRS